MKDQINLYKLLIAEKIYEIKILRYEYYFKNKTHGLNCYKITKLNKEITKLYLKLNQFRLKHWYWK